MAVTGAVAHQSPQVVQENRSVNPISDGFSAATPQKVPGLADIERVSAGYEHTCARKTGGALFCWGLNVNGQLATGDTDERNTPTLVSSCRSQLPSSMHSSIRSRSIR